MSCPHRAHACTVHENGYKYVMGDSFCLISVVRENFSVLLLAECSVISRYNEMHSQTHIRKLNWKKKHSHPKYACTEFPLKLLLLSRRRRTFSQTHPYWSSSAKYANFLHFAPGVNEPLKIRNPLTLTGLGKL